MRRLRWHRCRWYTIAVEHLAPAPGQDPPHGWTVVKRACLADWCAELAASVMPGTWSAAEARGLMPWHGAAAAAIDEPARRGGGLGGVARERASAHGGPFPAPVILGEPGLVAAAAGGPPWAEATDPGPAWDVLTAADPGPMPKDPGAHPVRPWWAWREPGEP